MHLYTMLFFTSLIYVTTISDYLSLVSGLPCMREHADLPCI